ncbi:DUF2182 domain-containing protein [Sedimenticola sp.]|uniref:DUF2182 domain-containing protein n=1 Tax=Sedimenticola sp. TaxID=1940285 RepID=UPI003D10FC7E
MTLKVRLLLQSNRALSLSLIVLMTLLAWAYLLTITQEMQSQMDLSEMGLGMGIFNQQPAAEPTLATGHHHHGSPLQPNQAQASRPTATFSMPALGKTWSIIDFARVLIMWIMMMIAMMLPTAAPMIVTYADILANQQGGARVLSPLAAFIGGYLITWGSYSLVAVIAQWGLLQSDLITEMMVGANPLFNGSILILAGLYQWSKLKDVCLTHCRTPLQFFLSSWQSGSRGALRMGAKHGAYCVGCCWALMLLMFFFGLMNLIWIAALSIIMLSEKILPKGELFGKGVGILFFIWGLLILGGQL